MVKNPPCNAEDSGSIPGQDPTWSGGIRSHMPWDTKARAPQLERSSCATTVSGDPTQPNKIIFKNEGSGRNLEASIRGHTGVAGT